MARRIVPRRLSHDEEATLVEHLTELRHRLLICIVALVPAFAIAYAFHAQLIGRLMDLVPEGTPIVTLGVTEPFTTSLKVSFYVAIALVLPILLWQVWAFLAPAVGDDTQRIALAREAEHRADEVRAARGEDPARAQDEVPAAARTNELLAGELAPTIGTERRGRIVLAPGLLATAVEDVVAAEVDEPRVRGVRRAGERADRGRVDELREVALRFGAVDRGVCGGIDDPLRCDRAHLRGDRIGFSQVAVAAAERDDVAERCERALQLPADLAVLAEEDDLQGVRCP